MSEGGCAVLRQRIETELLRRDWSIRKASRPAGLGDSTLKNFLSGKRRGVAAETARAIARVFEWPESEVLALAGYSARDPAAPWLGLVHDGLRASPLRPRQQEVVLALIREFVAEPENSPTNGE